MVYMQTNNLATHFFLFSVIEIRMQSFLYLILRIPFIMGVVLLSIKTLQMSAEKFPQLQDLDCTTSPSAARDEKHIL